MNEAEKRIAAQIRAKIDAQITATMFGSITTGKTVTAAEQEPLTLDKLRRMIASMPPRETWLSSRLFPSDGILCVSGAGENFTCAHPTFWLRAEEAFCRDAEVRPADPGRNHLGMSLTPIEIDPWPEDSEETAKWRAAHWDRLREAFEVAMQPLPDWLRSPPKFGKFG